MEAVIELIFLWNSQILYICSPLRNWCSILEFLEDRSDSESRLCEIVRGYTIHTVV